MALVLGFAGLACSTEHSDKLTVFAAASCADWVQELPQASDLRLQFGPSSGLARQIADGAPAQVYITAHKRWIDFLEERGKLQGAPIAFARNSLVCIALRSTTFKAGAPDSLSSLGAYLEADDRIAIADESVPAGQYARQALADGGQWEDLAAHFVGQDDVRSTLRAVSQGQAKVGFVYASDAQMEGIQILFELNPETHDAIRYWACAIRSASPSPAAAQFLADLQTADVQQILQRYGFQPNP